MANRQKRGAGSRALDIVRKWYGDAKRVVEADQHFYVEVYERHVKKAEPRPNNCPLARASCEEMELKGALISRGICFFVKPNGIAVRAKPHWRTAQMLNRFDKTGEFEPGIYRFDPVTESQRLTTMYHYAPKGGRQPPHGHNSVRTRTWLKGNVRARLNAAIG